LAGTWAVEGEQLVEDGAALAQAGVAEHLPAGDHVEGDAAKAGGDFHMAVTRVLAGGLPGGAEQAEAGVAPQEIVRDPEDDGAEGAVGAADQRAVGAIDAVALVARREQAGAAGDGPGIGVVLDRSHFAGEVGGGDDVDARERQKQDVGSLCQAMGDVAFKGEDFEVFALAIVLVSQGDPAVQLGSAVGRAGAKRGRSSFHNTTY
jgi:hypothetical protein